MDDLTCANHYGTDCGFTQSIVHSNGSSYTGSMATLMLVLTATSSFTLQAVLLEEVVVTAQKREQSLQDVGISVTAFSGNQIRELGYTNTIDIAAQTPGLGIIQFHPTLTTVNIRGISQNDFADHLEPPIAMYVDETGFKFPWERKLMP